VERRAPKLTDVLDATPPLVGGGQAGEPRADNRDFRIGRMRGPREGDKEACGRGCTAKEHVATADRMVTSAFHGGRFGAPSMATCRVASFSRCISDDLAIKGHPAQSVYSSRFWFLPEAAPRRRRMAWKPGCSRLVPIGPINALDPGGRITEGIALD
jgi:hypothetical protein